ncbi:MAG: DUF4143 domain-containing protein [Verrucomicrobiae bacterium]|nr:DUF4143 domain-containing protein [Verrucomicrobiae bacterium]
MLCAVLGIRSPEDLQSSPLAGAVRETAVGSELRRSLQQVGRLGELVFWREREREVDFVLHRGGRFVLAEAWWTELPERREAENPDRVAAQWPNGNAANWRAPKFRGCPGKLGGCQSAATRAFSPAFNHTPARWSPDSRLETGGFPPDNGNPLSTGQAAQPYETPAWN